MSGFGIVVTILLIGFSAGYAVREVISRRRRDEAKRRGSPL
jgi:hypothetical protein